MASRMHVDFSRPAAADKAVFLTIDSNYLAFALFTIDQIARSHPHRDFDFCILTTSDLAPHPLIDRYAVRICKLDAASITLDFPSSDLIPIAAYLRFYAARALCDDYRRILYLDADLFLRRGDLSRLMDIDLGDHPLAGARDPVQFRRANHVPKDMKSMGFGYFRYLSAGVQLIDTKRYNDLRIGERAVEIAVDRPAQMMAYDQTAINAVLQGGFAELPPVWNWLYGFRTIYYTELFNPAILHFAGRRKPWNHLNGEFPAQYANAYRAFFRDHFPERMAAMPPSGAPSAVRLRHLRYFLAHINGLRHFVPAMDRFRDDFDIRL